MHRYKYSENEGSKSSAICGRFSSAKTFLDAKTVLWFIVIIFLMSSIFYAGHARYKIQRFEDNIEIARALLRKSALIMERRIKRNVQVYDPSPSPVVQVEKKEPVYYNYGGVSYIRWGRRDCPEKTLTSFVYEGLAAGTHYSHAGGGSNYICLHGNVSYEEGKFIKGNQGSSHIYGVEFRDAAWMYPLFNLSLTERNALQFHSLPCVMCLAEVRISQIMIPGSNTCPEGWEKEYTGYIMGGGHGDTHSSKFICVDEKPHVVPGTHPNDKGSFLYIAETQCASLLCEPYVAGRELQCVVCVI